MDTVTDLLNKKPNTLLGYERQFPNHPQILLEIALEHVNNKRFEEAFSIFETLRAFPNVSEPLRETILLQHSLCVPYIIDKYIEYPQDTINTLVTRTPNKTPLVTFTITTCKRLSLFEPTINSFLRCCKDIHLIDEWICVDDNSSQQDRELMKQKYPFFTFYFKTPQEKGHPTSMNIIKNMVKTPYVFHMEDDWKFYCQRNYISECLEVLADNPVLGQCLLNKNYGEIPKNWDCPGGYNKLTASGIRYIIHEHTKNQDETNLFYSRYSGKPNCAYWPHYSFRPSLLRKSIWERLGNFDDTVAHFEMVYAYKYRDSGYVSAFLDGLYCMHTGRLTSEKDDVTKLNAYILNDEIQFGQKPKKQSNLAEYPPEQQRGLFSYVLNLDRRPDRWAKFTALEEPKFLNYVRVSAVDGTQLIPTEQLQRIFDGNDYNMRKGMVGCAMTHICLYVNFVNDIKTKDNDMMLIMEDDIEFVPDFQKKLFHLINNTKNWDLLYLGHHVWKKHITDDTYNKEKMPVAERWDSATSLRQSIGGTTAYIITKQGARKLLEFINTHGMTNGIDTVQQKAGDFINLYYPTPHLVYSSCHTTDKQTDTDIQNDFSSLTIPVPVRLAKQLEFFRDYTIQEFKDFEKFKNYISTPDKTEVAIYSTVGKENMAELKRVCIYPNYTLNDQVIIVVPKPTSVQLAKRWFERLKKNGIYTVTEAILYPKNK